MSDAESFFEIFSVPADWQLHFSIRLPKPVGGALTDCRFPKNLPFPIGASWNKDWLGLSYGSRETLARVTVGQYLPPQQIAEWQKPLFVELLDNGSTARPLPQRMAEIYIANELLCVSGRVRDAIESFEPRRHQFIPAKFVAQDMKEELFVEQEMQILNIQNWIAPDQLYDYKAMGGAYHEQGEDEFGEPISFRISTSSDRQSYLVRAEWLGLAHLFRTGSYSPRPGQYWNSPSKIYVSKQLHDALAGVLSPIPVPSKKVKLSKPSKYWQSVISRRP